MAAAALVAFVLVSGARLFAQEATHAPPSPREDLTASLRIERDRALEELLGRADALLQSGKFGDGIPLLDEVLSQSDAKLVLVDGAYRDAATEANRRIAQLPAAERERYERLAGETAETAISQAAHPGDDAAFVRLLMRYCHTRAGRSGLRNLAQSLCDQGRFDECTIACATLIDESAQPAEEIARDRALALLWCTAAVRADLPALARSVRLRFASVLDQTPSGDEIDRLLSAGGSEAMVNFAGRTDLSSAAIPPVWSVESQTADAADVRTALAYLSSNSVPPVGMHQPLMTPRGVVCRTGDGIVLLDVHTGEQLWRHPLPFPVDSRGVDGAVRRMLGDSLHMALAVDREHVYAVIPAVISSQADASAERNDLLALRLADGETVWKLDTEDAEAEIATSVRGVPTSFGNQLFVVAEREDSLRLLTIDRSSGRIQDDVQLCSTETGTVRDDRRLAQSCSVRVAGNLAVCSTGGGAVVAVDRLTGLVRWAFRYPRERLPALAADASRAQPEQVLWADGWRFPVLSADDRYVVLAGCESAFCRVLDTPTGREIWSVPRGDGLYVADVTSDRVIIAARNELRSYAITDGRVEWRAAVGQTAGRGFASETHYVVPLNDDCVAAVDLQTGAVVRTWSPRAVRLPSEGATEPQNIEPVSLVWTGEGVVAQSLTRIWRPQTVAAALASAADPATPPGERANLLAESGEFAEAIKIVRDALFAQQEQEPATVDVSVNHIADLSLLLLNTAREPAKRREAYLDGLVGAGHVLRDERRQLALHWEWLSRLDGSDNENDLRSFARTISVPHNERFYADMADDVGRVRLDRAVQAKLLSIRNRLEPDARQAFDQSLDNWDNVQGESTPAQLQIGIPTTSDPRLVELFGHFPFGQRLRLRQPQRWTSTAEFVTSQLRLLEQSQLAEPPLAAAALRSLLQLYLEHSDPDDAAGIARRLRDEFADVTLPDDTTVASMLDLALADPDIAARLSQTDEWPDVRPTIASRPWPEGEIYFVPVSVRHSGGGLFDRLNVAVHRQGKIVRFSGAGMPRPWALTLPDSRNPLRYSQSYPDLRRAWGFGQFLVLQVGAEVFGISPLNAAGEPRASIVWPGTGETLTTTSEVGDRQLIDNGPTLDLRVAPFDESVVRRNEFGHLVGRVGPVRAGYFCLQREGSVIACDTATGVQYWERSQLDPGVRCYGDDQMVILHDPDRAQFTRLNALDGRPLDAAPLSAPRENWLTVNGCLVLTETPVPPGASGGTYELKAFDLATNSETWQRSLPERSVPFPVDHRWCGVLSPDGLLQFVRLSDGVTVAQHRLKVPQPLIHVRSIVDPQRIIVIVSGTRDDDGLEAATRGGGVHTNENYRRLIVNGEWSAFDRATGGHLWTQPLENASLLLDQPVDVPLLVCNEQRVPTEANAGAFVGRVRVFDRRHGGQLLDEASSGIHNYFVVERDVDAGWVELRLPGRVVRFDYGTAASPAR